MHSCRRAYTWQMYTHRKESRTIVKKMCTRTCEDSFSINQLWSIEATFEKKIESWFSTSHNVVRQNQGIISTVKPSTGIKQETISEKNLARVTEEPVTLSVCCCADVALSA